MIDQTRPCPQCGRPFPAGFTGPHKKPDDTRCVFVLRLDTHYLLDDVHDGDYPHDDVREFVDDMLPDRWDVEDGVTVSIMTARLLQAEGLTEFSSHPRPRLGDWFSNPDGARTVNYGTGEEVESSAHLYGYTAYEFDQVVAALK
jgi:hypothetical protein